MTTWKRELEKIIKEKGENIKDLICTLNDANLKEEFDSGYGGVNGRAFTGWTKNWVYFPLCYDGSEWVYYSDHRRWGVGLERALCSSKSCFRE